jgi:hypothetical protein
MRPTVGTGHRGRAGSKAARIREDDVKELTFEEVLRIAGGVPLAAALDEVTYRAPVEPPSDPVDYARLAGRDLPVAEPS